MAKFCSKCGAKVNENYNFCLKCGANLEQKSYSRPIESAAPPQFVRDQISAPPYGQQSKKSNKKIVIGALSTVIVVVILIVFLLLSGFLDGENGGTTGLKTNDREDNIIDGDDDVIGGDDIDMFVGTWIGGSQDDPDGMLVFTIGRQLTVTQNNIGTKTGTYDVVDKKLIWYLDDGTYTLDYTFSNGYNSIALDPQHDPGNIGYFIRQENGDQNQEENRFNDNIDSFKFIGDWTGGPTGEQPGAIMFTAEGKVTIQQKDINDIGMIAGEYSVINGQLYCYLPDYTILFDYEFYNNDQSVKLHPIDPPDETGYFERIQ